jgi:hypothetical protein
MSNINANIRERSRTTAHVSGGLNIFGHQGRRGNFFANAPATVGHRAEATNVGSKFPKRSPLFTSVLFNHYSTNAADGYLSA